ncbi:hypothetical protein GCK72_024398 [Caenorhabditis remanei]|uniref:Heparan-sulfate 6-O-sulfotransferase n=1 Tax=Caenorhabditis remanei TaxID=31234 RepID=A0A6A5FZR0_CAERE|nr:hypothetical protein GCK72_024398 [Caenorhabditis remanei]KAF1747932.1 hypothetical protein GCK72_024398 [Caenorhabditis remanei]
MWVVVIVFLVVLNKVYIKSSADTFDFGCISTDTEDSSLVHSMLFKEIATFDAMKKMGMCSLRGWKGVLGRKLFVFATILFVASIVYFYIDFPLKISNRVLENGYHQHEDDVYNYEEIIQKEEGQAISFNKSSNDVIVFVHIQKTAGTTFEKFLVRYQQSLPCKCQAHKKRCNCGRNASNETWLFSRYSTGWVCGLHADFTELVVNSCVQRVLDKQADMSVMGNPRQSTTCQHVLIRGSDGKVYH